MTHRHHGNRSSSYYAHPAHGARIKVLIRIGLVLLVVSPLMCIGAMIADFYL